MPAWLAESCSPHATTWNAADALVRTITGRDGGVRAVAVAPDGTWLATSGGDGTALTTNAGATPRRGNTDSRNDLRLRVVSRRQRRVYRRRKGPTQIHAPADERMTAVQARDGCDSAAPAADGLNGESAVRPPFPERESRLPLNPARERMICAPCITSARDHPGAQNRRSGA
jgi:hypothetical protein